MFGSDRDGVDDVLPCRSMIKFVGALAVVCLFARLPDSQFVSVLLVLCLCLAWVCGCHPGPDGAQEAAAEAMRSNASLLRCLSLCVVCLAWVGGCHPGPDGAQEAGVRKTKCSLHVKTFR